MKRNLLFLGNLRMWFCQLGFMAVHFCLPLSTTLQGHVPATFMKNSCILLVHCHLLAHCNIICGDFSIHFDVPVGGGYKFMTFLASCDLNSQPTHLRDHILDIILFPVIKKQ